MTAVQLAQSKKFKIQNVRAKLQSMKNIGKGDQDSLLALQKSLQKHNKIDDPQTTSQKFSKKDQDDIIIEDKLWNYFKNKAQQYNDKIQREKVNGWHKISKTILQQTQKKIIANQNNILQMQNMIKNKYKQIHQLYKQIQNIKLQKQQQRSSRRKRSNVETSRGQKINIIYQNIQSIKLQIQQRSQQNQKIKIQLKKLKQERISFLVNVVKAGYYLNDGIRFFLQNIIEIGYKPNINIFPNFLDIRSKQYLMDQYQQMVKKLQESQKQTQRGLTKTRVKSNVQLGFLAKHQHFKDIYNGTKDYLHKLLLKQDWKKQETKLPKINFKTIEDSTQKRRQSQRKRIKLAYSQQLRQIVKKIQFGVKLDTILP